MYLIDVEGNVYTDELPVNESIVSHMSNTGLADRVTRLAEHKLLYKFCQDGALELVFIERRPYKTIRLSLYDLHVFQDKNELCRADCRILPQGDTEAVIYTDDGVYSVPSELLNRW